MLVCQAGTVLCGGGSGGGDREPPGVTSSLVPRRRRGKFRERGHGDRERSVERESAALCWLRSGVVKKYGGVL